MVALSNAESSSTQRSSDRTLGCCFASRGLYARPPSARKGCRFKIIQHRPGVVDADIEWPEPVKISDDHVIAGTPFAQTVITARTAAGETGLRKATEAEFTTTHEGFVEFVHIVEGEGELVHDDGTTWWLIPG